MMVEGTSVPPVVRGCFSERTRPRASGEGRGRPAHDAVTPLVGELFFSRARSRSRPTR